MQALIFIVVYRNSASFMQKTIQAWLKQCSTRLHRLIGSTLYVGIHQHTLWMYSKPALNIFCQACRFKKWHKDVQRPANSWACSLEAESLQEVKLIPTGIIREIFCGVYCTLVPLNVSFLFLLAHVYGLCYASAKPNRLRNGEVCQSMQCKMF